MLKSKIAIVLILSLNIDLGWSYKPVFVIHGILTGADSMKVIEDEIMSVINNMIMI